MTAKKRSSAVPRKSGLLRQRSLPLKGEGSHEGMAALGLVDGVLKTREFSSRLGKLGKGPGADVLVLDHVCREALPFAAALIVRRLEVVAPGRRVWLLCEDVRSQDQVHAELGVWHSQALYFPRLHSAATEEALPDPELMAERVSVLSRWRSAGDGAPTAIVLCADSLDEPVKDDRQSKSVPSETQENRVSRRS